MIIFKCAKDLDATKAVVKDATSPPWTLRLHYESSNPGNRDGFLLPEEKICEENTKFLDVAIQMLQYGISFPTVPESSDIMNLIVPQMMQDVMTKNKTPQQSGQDAAKKVDDRSPSGSNAEQVLPVGPSVTERVTSRNLATPSTAHAQDGALRAALPETPTGRRPLSIVAQIGGHKRPAGGARTIRWNYGSTREARFQLLCADGRSIKTPARACQSPGTSLVREASPWGARCPPTCLILRGATDRSSARSIR